MTAPFTGSAEEAAEVLTELMAAMARVPLKLSATWHTTAGGLAAEDGACPAVARAGSRIAQWIDQQARQIDRHAYHNRQHVCEVMLAAAFLGRLHRLPAPQLQLLLLAALVHDLDHPGRPGLPFAAERRAVHRALPFLQGAGVPAEDQRRLAALVLATEPNQGVRCALAAGAAGPGLPSAPPPTEPELQALQEDAALARLACLLCEADILPSVGLTPAYALALHARLAAEWGRPLAPADKLRFVERTLALGTVGPFFLPNVQRLRQALLAGLDHHALA